MLTIRQSTRQWRVQCALLFLLALYACAVAPEAQGAYQPAFFYLSFSPDPSLILQEAPGAVQRQKIPLNPPADCSLFALHPAPLGRWVAVEWECVFGPTVELLDTASGKTHFALSDPSLDSRFLAWHPKGLALYLKIGALSIPQTLRVDAASGQALEIQISPFAYDLTSNPAGDKLLYSLSNGIGFGSETWLAGPEGQNPSQLLVDDQHIIALAQYSPDGKQIAYIKFLDNQSISPAGELWVMDASGLNARKLANADAGRGFAPRWSPDGTKIAFVGRESINDANRLNLSVIGLAGAALSSSSLDFIIQPDWSPDGSLIAYSGLAAGQNTPAATQGDKMSVWLYNIQQGQGEELVNSACCAGWIR